MSKSVDRSLCQPVDSQHGSKREGTLIGTETYEHADDEHADEIRDHLRTMGAKRAGAQSEAADAMFVIRKLVIAGRELHIPVNEMAVLAGISRETAHSIIRESEARREG